MLHVLDNSISSPLCEEHGVNHESGGACSVESITPLFSWYREAIVWFWITRRADVSSGHRYKSTSTTSSLIWVALSEEVSCTAKPLRGDQNLQQDERATLRVNPANTSALPEEQTSSSRRKHIRLDRLTLTKCVYVCASLEVNERRRRRNMIHSSSIMCSSILPQCFVMTCIQSVNGCVKVTGVLPGNYGSNHDPCHQ